MRSILASILLIVLVFFFFQAVLIGAACVNAFFLRWMMPDIGLGAALGVGTASTIAAAYSLVKFFQIINDSEKRTKLDGEPEVIENADEPGELWIHMPSFRPRKTRKRKT